MVSFIGVKSEQPKKSTSDNINSATNNNEIGGDEQVRSTNETADNNIDSNTSSSRSEKRKRPVGTKRALEISKQVLALHKGAEAMEKLAEASQKRTKLAVNLIEIDKQNSLVALFSMSETNPNLKKNYGTSSTKGNC